ncbi:MAG: hypothetical protein MJ168_10830 [Clostridia bacterium]|nr:hypothetical protein [Clostridia bacterium]
MNATQLELIKNYRSGEITRGEFMEKWGKLQGITNARPTACGDIRGLQFHYRNTCGRLINNKIVFFIRGVRYAAGSIKAFVAGVDILGLLHD